MNATDALSRLRQLGATVVETADAAALLGLSVDATSKTMSRLAALGLISKVRHGLWWVDGRPDPYRLVESLTAPYPAYLSLQTALHLRGAIEQIPAIFYVVSLTRTQRITTSVGVYSVHHVAPELFGGFEVQQNGVWLASVEKALFDLAYLADRSRMFRHLPELELPPRFRRQTLREWQAKIPSASLRTRVTARLDAWLT